MAHQDTARSIAAMAMQTAAPILGMFPTRQTRANEAQQTMTTAPIFVLNGPNLNLLGTREPEIYGHTSLADVEQMCVERAATHRLTVTFRQSNHEGVLVDWIHEAINGACGIIINPAAFTHTSVAILDALKNVAAPVIELHISNPHKRETFRHTSYVTPAATATICGLGVAGYPIAIDAMAGLIKPQTDH